MRTVAVIAWVILGMAGCVSLSMDVSNHKEWWGGYERGHEYVLLKNVFLLTDYSKEFFLVPDRSVRRCAGIKAAPESIEAFKKNPDQVRKKFEEKWKHYEDKVLGIVEAGTKIKCVRLEKMDGISIWWGFVSGLDIFGKILDGPFADYEVNLQDVSTFACRGVECDHDLILFKPDPRLLRLSR